MPNHLFSIPCLRMIQDKSTGLYSIIDIVESVSIPPDQPMKIPPFRLFSKWSRSDDIGKTEKFEIKLRAVHGDGEKVNITKFPVDITKEALGIVLKLEIGGVKITKIGVWDIIVEWKKPKAHNWKIVSRLPIIVAEQKPSPTKP